MGELRRIFKKKSIWAMLALLFFANTLLFLDANRIQFPTYSLSAICQQREVYKRYMEALDDYADNSAEEVFAICQELPDNGDDITTQVNGLLYAQYEHIVEYPSSIAEVVNRAEQMKTGSVFTSGSRFSMRNIEKTGEDFKEMQDVEMSPGYNAALELNFFYNRSEYLVFAFLVVLVLSFLEERRKGLWNIVHATEGGRLRMGMTRACILLAVGLILTIFFWIENLLITVVLYGGLGDLSRSAQSIPGMSGMTMHLSVGSALAWMILGKGLVMALIGFLLWTCIAYPKREFAGVSIFVLIVGAEYLSYTYIEKLSAWAAFRYINLFAWMDTAKLMTEYKNLNLLGYAVGSIKAFLVLLPPMMAGFFIISACTGKIRPVRERNAQVPFANVISSKIHLMKFKSKCLPGRTNDMFHAVRNAIESHFHETWKIFVLQGSILILAAAAFLMVKTINIRTIRYDYAMQMYIRYVETLEGDYMPEKLEFLESESGLLAQKIQEEYETYGESDKWQELVSVQNKLNGLLQLSEKFEVLQQKQGITARYLNNIGYNRLFGEESGKTEQKNAILITVLLCLTLGAGFAFERQYGMKEYLASTAHGRRRVRVRKYALAAAISAAICVIVYGCEFYNVYGNYGLDGFDAPIQSVEAFVDVPFAVSVRTFLFLFYAARMAAACAVACLILFLSDHSKNMLTGYLTPLLLLAVPAGMAYLGADILWYVSVLNPLGLAENIRKFGADSACCMIGWFVLVGFAAMCIIRLEASEKDGRRSFIRNEINMRRQDLHGIGPVN